MELVERLRALATPLPPPAPPRALWLCLLLALPFSKRRTNVTEALVSGVVVLFLCIMLWTVGASDGDDGVSSEASDTITIACLAVLSIPLALRLWWALHTSAERLTQLTEDAKEAVVAVKKLRADDAKKRSRIGKRQQ